MILLPFMCSINFSKSAFIGPFPNEQLCQLALRTTSSNIDSLCLCGTKQINVVNSSKFTGPHLPGNALDQFFQHPSDPKIYVVPSITYGCTPASLTEPRLGLEWEISLCLRSA